MCTVLENTQLIMLPSPKDLKEESVDHDVTLYFESRDSALWTFVDKMTVTDTMKEESNTAFEGQKGDSLWESAHH